MTSEPSLCRRFGLRCTMAALLLLATGCATDRPSDGREYLDERTAATVTVAPRSLVLAYERPDLGANARDYVTLTVLDVNASGHHATYVVGYAWSTLDKRGMDEGSSTYELVVDDRVLPLSAVMTGFATIGLAAAPFPPPARTATVLIGPVPRDTPATFLDAGSARIVRVRAGTIERFAVW